MTDMDTSEPSSPPQTEAHTHKTIAFQGELGAYSHQAAAKCFSDFDVLPYPSFDDALAAVQSSRAELAMIPIENSTAGRVADIHTLLPSSGLYIIREHFEQIRHCLLALPGTKPANLLRVTSHVQALGQCRKRLRAMGLVPLPNADTAGAARLVSQSNDRQMAAIASDLAAEVYGLDILERDLQDTVHNTTRFVVLSKTPNRPEDLSGDVMTSLTFEVRSVPSALYKALGGFATNGVNITKLESYYESDSFQVSEFYVEIEGHEHMASVARALEELRFHSKRVRLLGTFEQERPRRQ